MNHTEDVAAHNVRTVAGVVAELKEEIQEFVHTRLEMLVDEMRKKLQAFKSAAICGAAGLMLLGTAWLLLNLAFVGLIAIAFWGNPYAWFIAFGIVGLFWLLSGSVLAIVAVNQYQGLRPDHTIAVLKEDKVWLEHEARNQI